MQKQKNTYPRPHRETLMQRSLNSSVVRRGMVSFVAMIRDKKWLEEIFVAAFVRWRDKEERGGFRFYLMEMDCMLSTSGWKQISDKRTKNQVKTDKTEHRMEKREKSKSTKKSTPTKPKVEDKAVTNMPRATVGDTSLTRSYIPKVSQTPSISPSITRFYKPIEDRCIHEGRVVDQLYYTSDHIDLCFSNIRLNCLYEINEPIVPCFILDFYSQATLQRDDSNIILISFMIQNKFITLSLQQFGQILRIPFTGQAVFTNEWDLSALAYSQDTKGPYHTDLPTPEEIHQFLQF
ncbi:hypothetical protein Tco_1068154 [Tanacetum coccineum]|uniref:Uncharacterized protein n=1 Tax=Tanacetum coccineum TaxID=301880 RepID=A0ABQ5HGV9_9ASTR